MFKFWPPSINPESMMECKLIAHPTWWICWKKLLGRTALYCRVGSTRLRPEWPWRARRHTIIPEESVQYWYIFLFPPPTTMIFFHLSSDQRGQCGKCFWRFSFILQNWTAPSFSRCTWFPRRRRWITFFEISYAERDFSPGSTSVQVLVPIGILLGEEPASSLLCGLAVAVDRHAKSCSLLFKFITNLFDPWEILTQEGELSCSHRHNSDLNSVLAVQSTGCNFQYGPNFGVPLDPFGCDASSSLGRVYSRQANASVKLWEFCSIFDHEILSDFNNT